MQTRERDTIGIVGSGAGAAALVLAWLRRGGVERGLPALAWAYADELDPHARARELEHACTLAGRSHAVDVLTDTQLSIADQMIVLRRRDELESVIEVDEAGVRWARAGARPIAFDPPPLLACHALIDALERGPGLRWLLVDVLLDRSARGGIEELDGRALARTFAARLPSVAGRLGLSLARGPQAGARIELIVQTNASSGAAGIGDVIENLARAATSGPGLRVCSRLHEGAAVLGDERAWVQAEVAGVGPLARVVVHFDPLALQAAAVWRRVVAERG